MAQDLLILKLLKIPVTIILFIWHSFSVLTYLPNYLIFLLLDTIIFSPLLTQNSFSYLFSWPIRLASLLSIVSIFCGQFYYLYKLLDISQMGWIWQTLIVIISAQICVVLMRVGYLKMIAKFNPKKLKSPMQHIEELWSFIVDLVSLLLFVINIVMMVNIKGTINYTYKHDTKQYRFLKHNISEFKTSWIIIIKFFYVKIYFRLFPWRYVKELEAVKKQENEKNVLYLLVLLTLLFWATNLDLLLLGCFGIYCFYLHPRKALCWQRNKIQHRKYRIILWFLKNSLIEICEIVVLLACMPFKFRQARQVLVKVKDSKDYTKHFIKETSLVIKLTLLKIPSLLCQIILMISVYKYRKMKDQMALGKQSVDEIWKLKQNYLNKHNVTKNYLQHNKDQYYSRQYISFRCFGSLIKEVPTYPFILYNTLSKPHNIGWLKHVLDEEYNIRNQFVFSYFSKNLNDQIMFIPAIIMTVMVFVYDPFQVIKVLKEIFSNRSVKKRVSFIPTEQRTEAMKKFYSTRLIFYQSKQSIMWKIFDTFFKKAKNDIFLLPFFIFSRLFMFSLLDVSNPKSAVEMFEFLLMLFYMRRVKNSGKFEYFSDILKKDQASGEISTMKHRQRFWKFANKSCRHMKFSHIISFFLPKKRVSRAIESVKTPTHLSLISQQYWYRYHITIKLIQTLAFFIVEIAVSLFGVIFMLPLTLWRMPSFFIMFKTHHFAKRHFFPILFILYKQMLFDILFLLPRIIFFFFCPISSAKFYIKNTLRYSFIKIDKQFIYDKQKLNINLKKFSVLQERKLQCLAQIATKRFEYLSVIIQYFFVKVLWVRKRDMKQQLGAAHLKVFDVIKQFLCNQQYIPNVQQLTKRNISEIMKQDLINVKFLEFKKIVENSFQVAVEDLPYLALMIFVFITLPWRFFYIKKSLLLMREDKIYRREFLRLLRKISQDYKCLLLYIILLLSIVRTKRTLYLIIRNIKLNFYVGFLKYSHLKQLLVELDDAYKFYCSLFILVLAFIINPLRGKIIIRNTYNLYKTHIQEEQDRLSLEKMHENTIKQGKQQKILTKVGHQVLLNIFAYLDTKELAKMSGVSRHMYEVVKERDEAWIYQWETIYANKYSNQINIQTEYGDPFYQQMCIKAYMKQHPKDIGDWRDNNKFYALANMQLLTSCRETVDAKQKAQRYLNPSLYNRMFTSLQYHINDGYGPETQWPQPGDNEQFLALMNIQRRPIVQLTEYEAYYSLLFSQPVQFIIVRLNRFYNHDQYRYFKQIFFLLSTYLVIPLIGFNIVRLTWPFDVSPAVGIKVLVFSYSLIFFNTFYRRYDLSSRVWVTLHPFNLTEDVKVGYENFKQWLHQKKIIVQQKGRLFSRFIVNKIVKPYIVRPLVWTSKKVEESSKLFYNRIVRPFYMWASDRIKELWNFMKLIFRVSFAAIKAVYHVFVRVIQLGINIIKEISKSVSALYFKILGSALIIALKFGMLGQLIYTIIALLIMISPSITCYQFYPTRWFIIFSTLLTMILLVTGYKHLTKIKNEVLNGKRA